MYRGFVVRQENQKQNNIVSQDSMISQKTIIILLAAIAFYYYLSMNQGNMRLEGHIPLATNEVITHSIQVKGINLYFQPHGNQSIKILSDQYQAITHQKLDLNILGLKIEKHTPLRVILRIIDETVLQSILNYSHQMPQQKIKSIQIQVSKLNQVLKKELDYKRKTIVIFLVNFRPEILTMSEQIKPDETWGQIIRNSAKKYNVKCTFQQIEITSQSRRVRILQHQFKKAIREQNESAFYITYIPNLCYFKGNSWLFKIHRCLNQSCKKQSNYQKYSIQQAKIDLSKGSTVEAFAYNPKCTQFQPAQINIVQEVSNPQFIHHIVATQGPDSIQIECGQNTLLLNLQKLWILAKNLNIGDMIIGTTTPKNWLRVYSITKNQKKPNSEKCYSLASFEFNNTIVNNFIIHNKNPIKLQVHMQKIGLQTLNLKVERTYRNRYHGILQEIKQNQLPFKCYRSRQGATQQIMEVYSLYVYREQKISDIFKQGLTFRIGNQQISKNSTFGDNFYSQENTIFVYKERMHVQSKILPLDKFQQQFKHNLQNLIFSESNQKNVLLFTLPQQQRNSLYLKWGPDYIGICHRKIIPLFDEEGLLFSLRELSRDLQNKFINQILVQRKTSIDRVNYLKNIKEKFRFSESKAYEHYRKQFKPKGEQGNLSYYSFFGISLYSSNLIFANLNRFLYQTFRKQKENPVQYHRWFGLTGWIFNSISQLPDYQGIIYRGCRNVKLQNYLGLIKLNQTVSLTSFTSGSICKNVAQQFSNINGCLITFIVNTGKSIQKFSEYPKERQVVLFPFTQFLILQHNLQSRPQTATLLELPLSNFHQYTVYLVDDNPSSNRQKYKSMNSCIKIIEVLNNQVMEAFLKNHILNFKLFQCFSSIAVISTMNRIENGKRTSEAGVDLLELIYNKHGFSFKTIIFTDDVKAAEEKINKRRINKLNWKIFNNFEEISKELYSSFFYI